MELGDVGLFENKFSKNVIEHSNPTKEYQSLWQEQSIEKSLKVKWCS